MATSLNDQNEDSLNSDDKTEEKSYVNNAFRGDDGAEPKSKLNNANQNIGNGFVVEKHLDSAITNNLNSESHTNLEHKKENNNTITENGKDNIQTEKDMEETETSGHGDPAVSGYRLKDHVGFDQRINGVYNLDNQEEDDIKNVTGSTFKRSLSFGDKPKRRQTKKETLDTRQNEDTFERPVFSVETEQSSSTDSAFSGDLWRLSLEEFTSKRQGSKRKQRKVSKQMRSYYKKQDELIDTYVDTREKFHRDILSPLRSFYKSQDDLIDQYEDVRMDLDDVMEAAETERQLRNKASKYAKATFAVNIVLLIIKVVAVVLSGSISLISSLVDSSVDLLSGVVIWVTTRAVKKTDRYCYPQGRTKLEPLSIVILAVIMSVASLQIIKESFTKIFGLVDDSQSPPIMDWATIGITSTTVVIKFILFILCRRIKHPTVQALALDHRNDVLSNFVAIVFGYLGSQQMQAQVNAAGLIYIDPIGAILISIYIIGNWVVTGWDQIKLLIGHTATAAFISKITWICVDHHKKIQKVDTVRAFHFGYNFLVEVDIVLPPEMTVEEAHDIAEPLQQKLERLSAVERAFVHIDYEVTHDPKSEHKVV